MRFARNLMLVLLCAVVVSSAQTPLSPARIVQINLADIVHPVSAAYIKDGLNHAKDIGARAVILRLNTPGGLVDSMREIVEGILSSPVPVITWVGPNGARSASAGFFILLAGDVAIMAPGGLLGVYLEITHPGFILPGVFGSISFIVALFAFNMLPVNWAGAALILLAIVLFVLEGTVTSHGILALGGIIAMIAGGLMLVEGPIPQMRVRLSTTLIVTFPIAIITVALVRLVYLSRKRKSVTGEEGMLGESGVAKTDIHGEGKVWVHGEYWNASSERPIPAGANVRITKVQGLKVEVEQL